MCIVVVKKSGVDMPSMDVLETCFCNNSDGAGIMYRRNGRVHIDKGYFEFEPLYKRIEHLNFTRKDTVVFHFRIATHGAITEAQCHPFPVVKDEKLLSARKLQTDLAVVHNGMIHSMPNHAALSDTMLFVRDILADDAVRPNFHSKAIQTLITEAIDNSKLAILSNDALYLFGRFISDHNGLLFSNETYRRYSGKRVHLLESYDPWEQENYADFEDLEEALCEFLDSHTVNGCCSLCGNHWKRCDCQTIAYEMQQLCSPLLLDYLVDEVLTEKDPIYLQLFD